MRVLLLALTLFSVLVVSLPATAQDDPRRKQAEAPFQEGLKLHDQGREASAIEKFREAYAIYPSPNVLFQIARSEEILGQHVEAIGHYREATRSPLLHPKNQELGRQYIAALEKRLARLDVRGPAGLTVTFQGKAYRLPLDGPIDLAPSSGPIEATGALGTELYEGKATAPAGVLTLLEMTSKAKPPVNTSSDAGVVLPPREPAPGFWTTRRTVGAIVGGVGALGLIGGLALVLSANAEAAEGARATAGIPSCVGVDSPSCAEGLRAAEAERDLRTGAAVSFVSGGILLATGVAILLWPTGSTSASRGRQIFDSPVGTGPRGPIMVVRGSMLQLSQTF
jgi:hypothetical protein